VGKFVPEQYGVVMAFLFLQRYLSVLRKHRSCLALRVWLMVAIFISIESLNGVSDSLSVMLSRFLVPTLRYGLSFVDSVLFFL
jgi:hypothetical protein